MSPQDKMRRSSARTRSIRAIWGAVRQMKLEEDDLYDLVEHVTGHRSISRAADRELGEVLDRLRAMGYTRPGGRVHLDRDDSGQVQVIKALWRELSEKGAVKNAVPEALNAFVKRQTGIDNVNWLTPQRANLVIESLKKWLGRVS